jgi:hypothetical protein
MDAASVPLSDLDRSFRSKVVINALLNHGGCRW